MPKASKSAVQSTATIPLPSDFDEAAKHLGNAKVIDTDEAAWTFEVVTIVPSKSEGNVRGYVTRVRKALASKLGVTADYIGTSVDSDGSAHTIAVYRRTDAEAEAVKSAREERKANRKA